MSSDAHFKASATLGKRAEIYPDSVDNDRISFENNRRRQITEIQDQGGTVYVFDYDKLSTTVLSMSPTVVVAVLDAAQVVKECDYFANC